jgi:hypothetical protein
MKVGVFWIVMPCNVLNNMVIRDASFIQENVMQLHSCVRHNRRNDVILNI